MLASSASNIRLIGTFHEVSKEVNRSALGGYGGSVVLSKARVVTAGWEARSFSSGREIPFRSFRRTPDGARRNRLTENSPMSRRLAYFAR